MNQESETYRQDLYMRIGVMKFSKTKVEESTCLAYTGLPIGKWAGLLIGIYFLFLFYYESRKRELKTRLIYEDRCDERLKN